MSLTSLCLMVINPPFLHDKACSTLNFRPDTRFSGSRSKCHPHLILIILVKACLFNTYPSSISGNKEKHIEEPLSFFWISFIYFLIVHNFSELFLFRNWVILFLMILSFELFLYLLSWLVISVRRLSVSKRELSYSLPHTSGNVGIPSPPSFVSKDNNFFFLIWGRYTASNG